MRTGLGTEDEISFHLRRSFTEGDKNYSAQFWYARSLYISGKIKESFNIFQNLRNSNIDSRIKSEPRGEIVQNSSIVRFFGVISNLEKSYGFIIRDGLQDRIFSHITVNNPFEWEKLESHKRVSFELAFNYRGPIAINIRPD